MKKTFTILIAALAAILMMAQPVKVVGQTRDYAVLYSAEFTTVATHNYTQNKTFTLNGKSWTASVSQVNGGVFYLGCNSNNASKGVLNNNSTFSAEVTALRAADNIYNSNYTTAHAYALQFDNAYSDVTKVIFNWDGGNNAFQVYLFGDSGSGYVLLGHTDYASSGASVSGSVEWTGNATNYTKFAIVARPGTTSSTATNKTLRASSFYIYKTSGGSTPTTYTVTYNANNGTQNPATYAHTGQPSGSYTVLPNTNANLGFTYTGHTFSEWNTEANGTGDHYNPEGPNNTINLSGDVTLYAQWNVNTYTVNMPDTDQYGEYTAASNAASGNFEHGSIVTLTYAPASGYENYVATWSKNGTQLSGNTFTIDSNATITVSVAQYVQPEEIEITPNYTFWGKTNSFSGSTYDELSGSQDNVLLDWTRGTGSTYASTTAMRFYKDNTLTFTAPTGYEIKSIVLTVSGTYTDLSFSPTGFDSETTTWSGSSTTVTMTRPSNASSYAQISKFTITIGLPSSDPSITVADASVAATASNCTMAITYDNLTISGTNDFSIFFCDAEGNNSSQPSWITAASISVDNSDYMVSCTLKTNTGSERTAYLKVVAEETTSNIASLTQAAPARTYTLATSIENGRHYIIANGSDKAMGAQSGNGNNRTAVDVSISDGVATVNNDDVREFVINGPDANGKYTIYDAEESGYLYNASTSSKSYLKTQSFNNTSGQWTITFDNDNDNDNKATITSSGNSNRPIIMYNSSSTLFNCYASGQSAIYLYMKDEVTPQYDFYMDIAAWTVSQTTGDENKTDGWYFIASPVNSNDMTPASVTNMIAETAANYDLYRLSGNTLENYKKQETTNFVIANGVGYLYSNAANTTLKFSGSSVKTYSTSDNTVNPSHPVWNLIGNPYTFPVRVSRAFSELNNGSAVTSKDENSVINPGAGIIVYGTEPVTFTKYVPGEQSSGPSNINIMLVQQVASRDGSSTTSVAIDNAVVSFNSNSRLPKFTLLEGNAKLYIPQNGEDYAIAFSNRQGDMPLNFKTTETGNYTISFEGDNMNLRGIYLIDMLAGQEIDLSVNPSYTFIGSPVDKAERFKIVFKNVGSNGEDIFAYQNGNDIIVSGEGELQIFDVTGRSVMTTTISGVETINVPTMGVYIFRLIGSEIKTQKIVVR